MTISEISDCAAAARAALESARGKVNESAEGDFADTIRTTGLVNVQVYRDIDLAIRNIDALEAEAAKNLWLSIA